MRVKLLLHPKRQHSPGMESDGKLAFQLSMLYMFCGQKISGLLHEHCILVLYQSSFYLNKKRAYKGSGWEPGSQVLVAI